VIADALRARLAAVPFSRWHTWPRLLVGSATFLDAFDTLTLAFVLPVLVSEWRLTPAQAGALIAAGYVGQFAGALFFGALAERIGRVRSLAAATALMSVAGIGCAWAGRLDVLVLLRVAQGIGIGGEMPVAAVYLSEIAPAEGRGRFVLLFGMIFPIGLLAAGQAGAAIVPSIGWPVLFLVGGIPGLVVAALLVGLPESPHWLIARGRLIEAAAIVDAMETRARAHPGFARAGHARVERPSTESAAAPPPRRTGILSPKYRRRTLTVWTVWGVAGFVTNGLVNWVPTLYRAVYGMELDVALRAATWINVAQLLVLVGCTFVIDRAGRRLWVAGSLALSAVVLAAAGAGDTAAAVVLVTIGYGVVSSVNAVLYVYTPEIYETRLRAAGAGASGAWLRLASAAGQVLVGVTLGAHGVIGVFLLFGAVAAVGAVAALGMMETRNRTLEEGA
jgi:MFS transporter, putative metabolite:H+ symporter